MAAVLGASLAGQKAMTATSGPGFSLKQELIGFAALCEIPCVIVNVQRGGPSTGLPTSPAQADVMQCKWGSHGDYPMVVLAPSSVKETYYLTIQAFNLAEKLRTPVILLSDEIVGHLYERINLPEPGSLEVLSRKRPKPDRNQHYVPFRTTRPGDIPVIPDVGTGFHCHTTGLIHDETGFPTIEPENVSALIDRLHEKIESRKEEICLVEKRKTEDAQVLLCSFGASSRTCFQVVSDMRSKGKRVGAISLKTLWPFPDHVFRQLPQSVRSIIVCEMNKGQIIREIERICCGKYKVIGVNNCSGQMIGPGEIVRTLDWLK